MQNFADSESEDELPAGWEQKSTEDGTVYFLDTLTEEIQWIHPCTGRKKIVPKDLPYGWVKVYKNNKEVMYLHEESGMETSVDPRLAFASDEKKHAYDFRQRFDSFTTAFQVLHGVDLSGKYALITGCNTGIGYETAKAMARHGCRILFANRNMEATQLAMNNISIETKTNENHLKYLHLDLSSLQSVKKFASEVKTYFNDHLDIVILNAGVFGLPYSETEDGYETTFQVNHLSHMYLALLLEPLLRKGSRVVFLSSESHRFADLKNVFNKNSLMYDKDQYSAMMAYNNSKLYNVTTANVLSEEWKKKGIAVNSVHPGNMVYSNLCKSWWLYKLAFLLVRPFTKSLQQAAATSVYVACSPDLDGVTGLYFNNCFHNDQSQLAKDKDINKEIFLMSLRLIRSRVGDSGLEEYFDKYRIVINS